MKQKIMSLFLVAFVFISTMPIVSASDLNGLLEKEQNIQKPDITDEIFETKEFQESRAEYLKEVYGENWEELYERNAQSVQNAQKIESKFPRTFSGDIMYPNYIGGLYINDDDRLVIQIVDEVVPSTKSRARKLYNDVLAVDEDAVIENVKYSYSEIIALNNQMEDLFLEDKLPSSVSAFYMNVSNNRIVVELSDYSEKEIENFKNTSFDSPIITFKEAGGTAVTIDAGAPNGAGGSVGYRARKGTSGEGFVTHGHGLRKGNEISGIGVVREQNFGGNVDASWVDTNGYSATPTNNWHSYAPYIMPTLYLSTSVKTSFYEGERVGKIGSRSGHRTGKITNVSWSGNVREYDGAPETKFTKMVGTDVYQEVGDSGGIVYYTLKLSSALPNPDGSTEAHMTAGIAVFKTNGNNMVFTRADYINSKFGLSRY